MMLAILERLTRRRARSLAVAVLGVCVAGVFAGPALAARQWGITMRHANAYGIQAFECLPAKKAEPKVPCGINPLTEAEGEEGEGGNGETFARESGWNTFNVKVENTGNEATKGTVTFTDRLPTGMTFAGGTSSNELAVSGEDPPLSKTKWECKVLPGAVEADCSRTDPLAGGGSYPPINLHVHVSNEAKIPTSTDVAKVTGGEAPDAIKEDVVKVTEAVPFGIDRWNVSVDEPFDQAGGHPFSVTTEIVWNYTTGVGGGGPLIPAGSGAKEAQGQTPPGFIGNPLVTPRCLVTKFFHNQCPANTAVGYTNLRLSGSGRIEHGKAVTSEKPLQTLFSSLIYNLDPAPGSPAQFGLIVQGLPYLLEAKLRSDGDYGVSVGDSAIGETLLAANLTFCENGVTRTPLEGKLLVEFHCNAASPSSSPFLSNATQCPASPSEKEAARWSLVTNPWGEPKDYQEKKTYVNMEGGFAGPESFVTGCEHLAFHPEMEFKPSPPSEGGTTQADEPTGMSLALRVPQTVEAKDNATPELKNLVMKLPAGLTASPSAADGLQACSNAQFGLGTEFGPGSQHTEPAKPASCPPASQVGTFEVFTPLLSGAPTITGEPGVRHSLTCSEGIWSGSPALTYQWLRNDEPIETAPGIFATAREYVVGEKDEGQVLQCQVSATNAGGRSVAVSRDVVAPARFKASLKEGSKFVTEVTNFKGVTVGAEVTGRAIPPDTTVTKVDEAKKEFEMSFAAETTEKLEEKSEFKNAVPVRPFPSSGIGTPSGTPSAGNKLTCPANVWTGGPELTYRWLRGGVGIAGVEGKQYTLTAEDEGKVIQCQVRGENPPASVIADSPAVVVSPAPSSPPLPSGGLQGQVYVGQPECSPCTEERKDAAQGRVFRLFLEAQDPSAGIIIKLHGAAYANETTGQLETRFEEQPQQPFELLQLKLNGGPRATLANPQSCGSATSRADLTPWSAPSTPDAILEPSFAVDSNGAGAPCPAAWPFNPSFNAGTSGPMATTAGGFTHFSLTFGREDREQDLSGVEVHLPLGLVGKIAAVKQCGEVEVHAAERNEGECPAESQVGTSTAGAGPGPDPFFTKGKAYLTGPYKGAPFGLAVVTPAIAGPFNLGNIVVRSAIRIDPNTAAVTAIADPLPQFKDGVLLRVRKVNVEVNNPEFMLNPTNCSAQQVSAKLTSAQGATAQVSSPFNVGGCGSLSFSPELTATAGGHGSKANGTSFVVVVKAKAGQANIAKTFLQLPIALPSRLSTIQKACVAAVFEANPAACQEGSNIGTATAHTPLLKNPLVGPAYLVSHGNAAFPDVEFVLQGEGITLILDGKTDIKKGITYSRFESVPDAPVSTFETVLPAGPHSALSAVLPNGTFDVCNTPLLMPTEITGQNGAVIKQTTHITATGCPAAKPTVKILKVKLKGNTLLVTVQTGGTGTVRISGLGLKTTSKHLTAGTHQVRVPLTKRGRSMRRHRKKTTVHVSLTVGKQVVAKTTAVRL
jgi:uncharacterized repeat protein (TIGR01451 family)